jgi:hypothetical protein
MGDGKILGSGQPKIGKKKRRIIELKWMFNFYMYLVYDGVLIMIRIELNKLSNFNWFSC